MAIGALLLASCTPRPPRGPFVDPAMQGDPNPEVQEMAFSYWDDPGGDGQIRVTIDLSDQAAYIYRGDQQIGRSRVATGFVIPPR